jgi:hypothetical protein
MMSLLTRFFFQRGWNAMCAESQGLQLLSIATHVIHVLMK